MKQWDTITGKYISQDGTTYAVEFYNQALPAKGGSMIESFVKSWYTHQNTLREKFAAKHPGNYKEVVRNVVEMLAIDNDIDPERIHEIDDGDYQGTLVYVIAERSYQPDRYWYVMVNYGSCSGCDTLEAIRSYDDGQPDEKQINEYMTLALHIVQGFREMENVE